MKKEGLFLYSVALALLIFLLVAQPAIAEVCTNPGAITSDGSQQNVLLCSADGTTALEWQRADQRNFQIIPFETYDVISNAEQWITCNAQNAGRTLLAPTNPLLTGEAANAAKFTCTNFGNEFRYVECCVPSTSGTQACTNTVNPNRARYPGSSNTLLPEFRIVQSRTFTTNNVPYAITIENNDWSNAQTLIINTRISNDFNIYLNLIGSTNNILFTTKITDHVVNSPGLNKWMRAEIPLPAGGFSDVAKINFHFLTNTPITQFQPNTLEIGQVYLIPQDTSSVKFCTGASYFSNSLEELWISDLDDTTLGLGTNSISEPAGQSACNALQGASWTGTKCCGDDPNEYYTDTDGACWASNPISPDATTMNVEYTTTYAQGDTIYPEQQFTATITTLSGGTPTTTPYSGTVTANNPLYVPLNQIIQSANACNIPTSGLIGWWKGDGDVTDSAGNHHGTLYGSVTFRPGKVNQAFYLDSDNELIDLPDFVESVATTTLCAWVNTDTSNPQTIINGWSPGAEKFRLGTVKELSTNSYALTFGFHPRGQPAKHTISSAGKQPGQWYFACGTYDGTSGKVYVDGVRDGIDSNLPPGTLADINPNLALGLTPSAQSDKGYIDEVRIYDRALSPGEIQSLYDAELSQCGGSQSQPTQYAVTTSNPSIRAVFQSTGVTQTSNPDDVLVITTTVAGTDTTQQSSSTQSYLCTSTTCSFPPPEASSEITVENLHPSIYNIYTQSPDRTLANPTAQSIQGRNIQAENVPQQILFDGTEFLGCARSDYINQIPTIDENFCTVKETHTCSPLTSGWSNTPINGIPAAQRDTLKAVQPGINILKNPTFDE